MSDTLLTHGQNFQVGEVEFEVVTISTNQETGRHQYEIVSKEDADYYRNMAEESAEAERQAAAEAEQAEAESSNETQE